MSHLRICCCLFSLMFLVASIHDQIERNTLDCHLVWELKELDIEISIIDLENLCLFILGQWNLPNTLRVFDLKDGYSLLLLCSLNCHSVVSSEAQSDYSII